MSNVNLDALIPRDDFEVKDQNQGIGRSATTLAITELKEKSFFFSAVRKPDFQRETNEWDSQKISGLIESFLDGDLIPAIILWRNAGSYTFVIDGSHRLSALAAWVNDDYGDGPISTRFYESTIPDEQKNIAEETRTLIRKRIGAFKEYELALTNPGKVRDEIIKRAKTLGALALQLQWVDGDATKAEASFFKINQQAAPIDQTELLLLEARKKPNGIAARAIIRSGTGHKYWSKFSEEKQSQIEEIAKEINDILFIPDLKTPIKTLDLPIGGKIYSAQTLALIFGFVNIVNGIKPKPKETSKPKFIFFNWDNISGNDTGKLKKCLKENFNLNWTRTGTITKIDNGITISSETNSISFKLNNERTKVSITINDGRFYEWMVKNENDKLNIYPTFEDSLYDDENGDLTIKFLTHCKKIAQRINSNYASSLGLHPAVYFYSQDGRHKTASFYAVTALMLEIENNNLINDFIKVREKFEEILIVYDYVIQQIVRKHRRALHSYEHVKDFYLAVIKKLLEGKTKEEALTEIIRDTEFKYLTKTIDNDEITETKEFSEETKSAIFIKEALTSALKCKICKGYIHRNSISIDHIIRKQDGGSGIIDNGQLTHPYCNTTVKN